MAIPRALLSLIILSACSIEQGADGVRSQESRSASASPAADLVLALYADEGGGGMNALVEGTLRRSGQCLYLDRTPPGSGQLLPVFPASKARWDAPREVLFFDGREYRLGQRVTFAGGETRAGSVALVRPLPAGCERSAQWIVAPAARGRSG